jgi:hypothetical protein
MTKKKRMEPAPSGAGFVLGGLFVFDRVIK